MVQFKIENLSFTYPAGTIPVLQNINMSVSGGEFITLCGKSGCGKTTLLRLLKPCLSPHGNIEGSITFQGKPVLKCDHREQASKIGFVMQDPDNQIVTDKVWHELAFGLESLGFSTPQIRAKVSEIASFFGIESWFHKKVVELSGGQKQLLNLASVMVMQPEVLILDEPTSQLDPIAAQEFLNTVKKINTELGTTIILTEHRTEEAFPISDRVVIMDEGKIIANAPPEKIGELLKGYDIYAALPTPVQVWGKIKNNLPCPVSVRDGRIWLERFLQANPLTSSLIVDTTTSTKNSTVIEAKDLYFRYEKNLPDVIKEFNLSIYKGEIFAIMGGNGTGKSTALLLMAGALTPYRGKISINNKTLKNTKDLYMNIIGVLPQDPKLLFVKNTVYHDLYEICKDNQQIQDVMDLCKISELSMQHPFDLSGGEQQRVALAKVLLKKPQILLLDEPTKGMDAHFKKTFADILYKLKLKGTTTIMVSHDIEFCAKSADRCALMFDGNITSKGTPREFFTQNMFYTTSASRMSRTWLPDAILAQDIINALNVTGKDDTNENC